MNPSFRCHKCRKMANPPMIIKQAKPICEPCSETNDASSLAFSPSTLCVRCCKPLVELTDDNDHQPICAGCLRLSNHEWLQHLKGRLQCHSENVGQNLAYIGRTIDRVTSDNKNLRQDICQLLNELQQVKARHRNAQKLLAHFRKSRVSAHKRC